MASIMAEQLEKLKTQMQSQSSETASQASDSEMNGSAPENSHPELAADH